MTIDQLAQVKQWFANHHNQHHRMEASAWNLILLGWVLGWVGVPVSVFSDTPGLLPLCAGLFMLPTGYEVLRRKLHRAGKVRCDWLTAL